ncbi:GNAT family N-acetyltransferase [Streptomyces meridianus]|uniref:GNAT family N-acetyltransferase n=1 Tax=Streptomyces meridianus TaxID=2938945 RepID=A0ABT0XD02_9ACTN|nr:GNAT family N-acetyltransferase [Streptomyces meridianus]MCM2580404.1 GNAT family N-acetyltransferase [Streptomyces meridianus]
MGWTTTHDIDVFTTAAGDFLRRDPVGNTLPLSVADTLRSAGLDLYGERAPEFGWWTGAAGRVAGAFLCTPPRPLLLSAMPAEAAAELADDRARVHGSDAGPDPARCTVNGAAEVAQAFAGAWQRCNGQAPRVDVRFRLHRLTGLVPPNPAPPGLARAATPADRPLLIDWLEHFARDTHEPMDDIPRIVDHWIRHGGFTLWETDGTPVACAGSRPSAAGSVRIGPVYTPDDQRRRGYGGAVTAAVTRAATESGAREILLFTDLANPTSNALYRRLGYRPVEDRLVLSFGKDT